MNAKAYLFDMDGTLVDSILQWRQSTAEAVRSLGVTGDVESITTPLVNSPIQLHCPYLVEAFNLSVTPSQLWQVVKDTIKRHYLTDVTLKSGVTAYLDKLKSQGARMGVVSGTPADLVGICLERFGLKKYFDFYWSCVDFGVGKESPVIFEQGAKQLGFLPQDVCVVDDALIAIKTAHDAGFLTMGVADTYNQHVWKEITKLSNQVVVDWNEM